MSRNERDDAEAATVAKLGSSQTKLCAKILDNLYVNIYVLDIN